MANQMPSLPRLPKAKKLNPCACGCGTPTGHRFAPGHDSKLYSWVKTVKAGILDKDQPNNTVAQLDAARQWLTEANVLATAGEMRVKWNEEGRLKRAAKAEADAIEAAGKAS